MRLEELLLEAQAIRTVFAVRQLRQRNNGVVDLEAYVFVNIHLAHIRSLVEAPPREPCRNSVRARVQLKDHARTKRHELGAAERAIRVAVLGLLLKLREPQRRKHCSEGC